MPSSAIMPVRLVLEAATFPAALATLVSKMAALCPGMAFEIRTCSVEPKGTALAGPPWSFTFECVFTILVP